MEFIGVEEFIKSQEKEDRGITQFKENILVSCEHILDAHGIFIESSSLLTMKEELYSQLSNSLSALDTNVRILEKFYNVEPKIETPSHYSGKQDVIAWLEDRTGEAEFASMMIFNIVKYTVRLGRKDDEAKEVEKIRVYLTRLTKSIEKDMDYYGYI